MSGLSTAAAAMGVVALFAVAGAGAARLRMIEDDAAAAAAADEPHAVRLERRQLRRGFEKSSGAPADGGGDEAPEEDLVRVRMAVALPSRSAGPAVEASPMRWDTSEGAWMLLMSLGKGTVIEFVLDSGSGQLSAKGADCKWTTCGKTGCKTRACPCGNNPDGTKRTNCSVQHYVPEGRRLAPGQEGAGNSTKLKFGTQEDTVTHYKERVCLEVASVPCDALTAGPSPHHPTAPTGNKDEMLVHLIHAIDGTSSSNICGISRPVRGGRAVVLSHLLAPQETRSTWSCVLFRTGGWFLLGPLPLCLPPPQRCSLVWPRVFASFSTRFYVVRMTGLEVSTPGGGGWLPVPDPPQYIIVDTGTTCTYASPSLGARMRSAAGYDAQHSSLRFVCDGGLVLEYSAAALRDPDFPKRNVFKCDPGTTLQDFDNIFSGAAAILLGAVMMRNFGWEFDLVREEMGVCPIVR
jgi:hypothetical protein